MRMWGGRFSEANDPRVADFTRSIELDRVLADDDLDGVDGPRPRSRPGGHPRRRRGRDDRRRARGPPRRGRGRDAGLGRHARGCPPQPRGGTRRSDRSARRQAPHGTLPQRPGRDRPAAVAAADDRPPRRGRPRPRGGTRRSRRARRRPRSCRGRPTSSRPSPSSSLITSSPTSRCSSAIAAGSPTRSDGRTSARSARARWPGRATRSTARRRPASSASTASTANSLDAVSDRDFVVEFLAAAALAMVHLSRLAEEITWWSNPRFGFVRVADAFSTGSSMMPNKKNPDPAELVRGRTGAGRRRPRRDADDDQGPAARLPARPPGGQGRRCSMPRRRSRRRSG